jgi:hypothetical protein
MFPAIPGGRAAPTAARSLARLVAGLRTAVVSARTAELAAMVVFLEREPVDGLAVRGGDRVTGADVLDEIAAVPIEVVTVTELAPELARVLGSYFLPTAVRGMPASVVLGESFVRSLAKPGQRGCVLVRSGDGLGLVFVAASAVLLAYRQDGDTFGGFEQVASMFEDPTATLWARLGPALGDEAPTTTRTLPAEAPPPVPEPPAPAPIEPAQPAMPPGLVDAVLDEVRQVLGPHTVRVEGRFKDADPTVAGIRAAAESLREQRVRLISPATMDLVASRVLALLDRRSG